ncbi:MAG: discoidin domain-containing protein [Tannerella sp.]|jgi:hypothetical protein|nr:discoidin domain-containing protein [Tannerella sp.]
MKKREYINQWIILLIFIMQTGCSPMDRYYSGLIPEADKIYPGKADSVVLYPGNGRLIVSCRMSSDPKVTDMKVYWNNRRNYVETGITPDETGKRKDVYIEAIPEGSYSFELMTFDGAGRQSVATEAFGRVYGDRYVEGLSNRAVRKTEWNDSGDIIVTWTEAAEGETGIELTYTATDGKMETVFYPRPDTSMTLTGLDVTKGVAYRTLYLPEPAAIDTFSAAPVRMPIVKTINVALSKPVSASDILDPANATQHPANAVDGNYATSAPRWVSTAAGDHWLEIDLQGEYTVNGFKTWNGAGGYNNPVPSLKLQAWVNDGWVDVHTVTGNADPLYGASFAPVLTTRVRYYTYSQVRLYEIEIYSQIIY